MLAVAVERDVDAQIVEGLPPETGVEILRPGVEPRTAAPGLLDRGGNPAVSARQDALEQAALDVVNLDRHRPQLDTRPQVPVGPVEVPARLHAVPLVGRVRLGHEVGHRGRDLGVAAGDLLANPRDRLGHLDDPVEVGLVLAWQPAHEVELDLAPASSERLGAAFIKIFIVDWLANLFAHVVARDLGASVRPLLRPSWSSARDLLQRFGDPQAGQ